MHGEEGAASRNRGRVSLLFCRSRLAAGPWNLGREQQLTARGITYATGVE